MSRTYVTLLLGSSLLLITTSCQDRRSHQLKRLTAAEAIQVCQNGLQQMLEKDSVEYGAIQASVLGQPQVSGQDWSIDFALVPGRPKRYMQCVAKFGGGVSITLKNALQ
ncbi:MULTISPECIES: hypothetical protein [Deinococcus]|uniref:Lipoprotein n=1 Tax=Deinococcus daejeonensis TaxID=1007098 RepID=A0ABQ2JFH3_9DEIO|nr:MULTISPECIES: hypothetical protein [Deinococcus]MDK2014421.1 hypothetical protein [Deinococcus sp. 43]GGN45385.1 hypothetical protein GCM10010842_34860 [Deinococcus daejeonensis]